ncbi:MAG: haloacid dehalogenase [Halothiobacillus sp. 14-56-357]|jgi:HAD superfamily hydrolase (TIGR01484 family)|uniref:HAD-IIB family hydrolase n=1 Tax=Halothiobacillus sp. 15-55-196 TaxID=1970382 RepID=UPI000BD52671|nr:HAD-IIB family hydrolase [Halothiobacillus sp. 15-55-196]OZB36469.1 MAG: haloacid dehalogenase [Halothiobacillus sp. 15-55-196]OZB57543.1 MAG: haloacid dehalogenase [Halothiobacillus sp. 14-56-357]OZB78534.1 MAG: haloacid dehalogenase [Halothiobacillus sp. 13-55-115]
MTSAEMTPSPILLCCDLDRTLIPNGAQPESPDARPRFRALCAHPGIHLVMVSGRHIELVLEAIDQWDLPEPDYIIGDVGTSIYTHPEPEEGPPDSWAMWRSWAAELGPDWNGMTHNDITDLFSDIKAIVPQPIDRQGVFKASYFVDIDTNLEILEAELVRRLWQLGINARLIWSVDEAAHTGLLDVLPASASKLHAIEFLSATQHYPMARTVFAGDSGNDLEVLGSHIQSVLVANAPEDVRARALALVESADVAHSLYLARGGLFGMNGNYAAGVLEGLAHFLPETLPWMQLEQTSH